MRRAARTEPSAITRIISARIPLGESGATWSSCHRSSYVAYRSLKELRPCPCRASWFAMQPITMGTSRSHSSVHAVAQPDCSAILLSRCKSQVLPTPPCPVTLNTNRRCGSATSYSRLSRKMPMCSTRPTESCCWRLLSMSCHVGVFPCATIASTSLLANRRDNQVPHLGEPSRQHARRALVNKYWT